MDLKAYLESGLVEAYCLGLLPEAEAQALTRLAQQHPELEAAIHDTLQTLTAYAAEQAPLPDALRPRTLATLAALAEEEHISLDAPPLLHRHSDAARWRAAVAHIPPPEDSDETGMKFHFLKETDSVQLCIAWLNTELVEAEHHPEEFHESFLILEGSCTCQLGDRLLHLRAGDYLDIPPDTPHSIRNTSEPTLGYVKALIQRRKVA
jgi:mannose-6-phosphate isomerase-like protein (cupin superfamily)